MGGKCYFSLAAVANYHKLSKLKATPICNLGVLGGEKSEKSLKGPKSRCCRAASPLEAPGETVSLAFSRFWTLPPDALSRGSFLHLHSASLQLLLLSAYSLSLSPCGV